jgi:cell division protein FtsN
MKPTVNAAWEQRPINHIASSTNDWKNKYMARKDREELQAFAQKMHDEGAAGFASGLSPWETWDDFKDRMGSRRVWQGTSERVADRERPSRSFGDRVLTTMTVLAVTTLAIGIAGVYITREPALQVADNRAQLPSTRPAMAPETLPPRQGMASREGNVALNTAWIPATETPASPLADSSITMDTAAGPSGAKSVNQDSDTLLPALPADDINMLAILDKQPAGAAIPAAPPAEQTTSMDSNSDTAAAPEPDTDKQLTLAALNNLPAPAAGIPATAVDSTAHDRPAANIPSEPAPESAGDSKPATVTAEPGNSAPAQPVHLSELTVLDVHTEPRQAPDQDIKPNTHTGNSGDWSINIASYLRQSTAEKMRSRFLDKGVATELATAIVNDRTYYRLRVTGFESKAAAITQSTTIKEKLGLEEAWITKE